MSGVEFPVRATLDDKAIKMLAAEIMKTAKAADLSEKEIKQMNDQLQRTGHEGVSNVNNLNKQLNGMVNDGLKKVGSAFLAAFAIDRLVSIGKEIFHITAEFQKLEAVLTNALGSKSAAQIGMRMIEQFAAKTPFSVQELTASYVKLVNQGFIPTQEELRKLGDLSASTGKGFDQLTEAIIDAQTGEFERLKEFGVRASKEGDKVTFTFKGVKTQVDFTSESIQKYVLSLGDAVGVSGSMAAISETVGGGFSNMGDAYDHFLETIGDGNKGPLQNAIKNLTSLLAIATEWVKTDEQIFDDKKVEQQEQAINKLKTLERVYGDLATAAEDYVRMLDYQIAVNLQASNKMGLDRAEERNALEDEIQLLKAQKQAVLDYVAAHKKAEDAEDKKAERIENIITLTADLKKLQQDQLVQTGEQLAQTNREIEVVEEKIKTLKELGLVMTKLHNISKVPAAFEKYLKMLADANSGVPKKSFGGQLLTGDVDALGRSVVNGINVNQPGDTVNGEKDTLSNWLDEKQDLLQAAFDFEMMLQDELEARNQLRIQNEIAALEAKKDYELSMVEDNKEAQERINKTFYEKERQLKAKQAERDKRQALFNILNSTAQGVMSALATSNVPLSVFVAAMGAVQLGLVASRDVPKFAKGKYRIHGPGTETSDSIPALLSRNESVVSAERSNRFADILKPIIENPNLNYTDLKKIVDSKVQSSLRGDLWEDATARRDANGGKLDEINQNLIALQKKRVTSINIDENGFNVWTRKEEAWTKFVKKRYSCGD